MKSKLQTRFWFAALVACFIGATTHTAHAQAFYLVSKTKIFSQTSSAGAVADPNIPFEFSAQAASNVTFALPSGATQVLSFLTSDSTYRLNSFFGTQAALDAAYPGGTYRMTGTGLSPLSFDLTTDSYPTATPQVTGGTWNSSGLLVVDPTQAVTINFSTFSGYATLGVAGHISFKVKSLVGGGNLSLNNETATQAVLGLTAAATPFTSFVIPAGTLSNGVAYQGQLFFDTLTTLDTTSVPGGGAVGIFRSALGFYIAAQTPGTTTPPPVIISQPASQNGVLGGTVTFNIGVTVGGSAPTGNLVTQWAFNGQPLNLDGTKYAFTNTGAGLVVKNLAATDAGSYTVTFVNAGGLVTSTAAALTFTAASPPVITQQPAPLTVTVGSTVVFNVGVSATPAPTYQWRKDGADISGGTGATLVLHGAILASAGSYSVAVTNSAGSVTSTPAALTVTTTSNPGRLINLSVLTPLAAGESMTMGTVLGGAGTGGTKPLLARAAGPSLASFGVTGYLPDPTMTLNSTSVSPAVVVATNNDWAGAAALNTAFASVGAFAYVNATSKDAAIFQPSLLPGNYTVQVSDATGGSGTVIAELYDATSAGTFTSATPRLINVSVLKQINTGTTLTVGFVVGGSTAKTVLIRAIGPGLTPLGVGGVMADPTMTLTNISASPAVTVATNNDWGGTTAIADAARAVGAFTIGDPASKDAILLVTLAPGNYTAQVSAVGPGGTAIVEVYEVP